MADNSSGVKSELPNVETVAVEPVELEDEDISSFQLSTRLKERVFAVVVYLILNTNLKNERINKPLEKTFIG